MTAKPAAGPAGPPDGTDSGADAGAGDHTAAHPFSMRHVTAMLGLQRSVVERLVAAGFVAPARGPRNAYRFSFQDVILLRTAHGLQAASVPPRRLVLALRELVAQLPPAMPLAGLRIQAVGGTVVVRHGGIDWEPLTGQLTLDFEVRGTAGGTVAVIGLNGRDGRPGVDSSRDGPHAPAERSADDWFRHGQQLEAGGATDAGSRAAAGQAYRRALQLAPALAAAAVNLGALLCEDGRCADAADVFGAAIAHCPQDALLHFNRAIALEDMDRLADAVASYQRALQLAPDLDDAHYNLARLHQRLGQPHLAIRHYGAYRRSAGRSDAPLTEPG